MTIPTPTAMRDRWRDRPEPPIGSGTIYWHVLMRDHPAVLEAADEARNRLHGFPGLHRTPREWLHMTMYVAGPTDVVGSDDLRALLSRSQDALQDFGPVAVTTGKVLYHPEAVMLAVEPADRLRSVALSVARATQETLGPRPDLLERIGSWTPHVTVAYSTAAQDSAPIVGAVGDAVRTRSTVIERISLVKQWGPERDWNWEVAGEIRVGEKPARAT